MRNSPPPRRRAPRRVRPPARLFLNPLVVLLGINLLFFIITSFNASAKANLAFFPAYLGERPWTLLTAMFVHMDIWHILFNMIALYIFGGMLRRLVSDNSLLILYLVGGIVGNLAFWLFNQSNLMTLVLGASGAVYAVAAALAVIVPKLRVAIWGILPMPLWTYVAIFMVLLSVPGIAATNVAWQAHLGGLVIGLIAGFIFRRRLRFMVM